MMLAFTLHDFHDNVPMESPCILRILVFRCLECRIPLTRLTRFGNEAEYGKRMCEPLHYHDGSWSDTYLTSVYIVQQFLELHAFYVLSTIDVVSYHLNINL